VFRPARPDHHVLGNDDGGDWVGTQACLLHERTAPKVPVSDARASAPRYKEGLGRIHIQPEPATLARFALELQQWCLGMTNIPPSELAIDGPGNEPRPRVEAPQCAQHGLVRKQTVDSSWACGYLVFGDDQLGVLDHFSHHRPRARLRGWPQLR